MNASFYIGAQSSKVQSYAIDVWGNNIANINTVGYKANGVDFATLFENVLNQSSNDPVQSDIGNSVRVNSTAIDTTQGTFKEGTDIFNMAIGGKGWFGITNDNIYDNDPVSFTRNGEFSLNANGYITNQDQNFLLGTDYKIITQKQNGDFRINTDATAITPSSNVSEQNILFAPKNLFYPHTVTTEATLQKNLYSENKN